MLKIMRQNFKPHKYILLFLEQRRFLKNLEFLESSTRNDCSEKETTLKNRKNQKFASGARSSFANRRIARNSGMKRWRKLILLDPDVFRAACRARNISSSLDSILRPSSPSRCSGGTLTEFFEKLLWKIGATPGSERSGQNE